MFGNLSPGYVLVDSSTLSLCQKLGDWRADSFRVTVSLHYNYITVILIAVEYGACSPSPLREKKSGEYSIKYWNVHYLVHWELPLSEQTSHYSPCRTVKKSLSLRPTHFLKPPVCDNIISVNELSGEAFKISLWITAHVFLSLYCCSCTLEVVLQMFTV